MVLASRSVPALLVLLTASAIAAGCGDGGGSSGGIVPRQAALVLEVDIRRGDKGQWGETTDVLSRVPAWQLANERIPEPQRIVDQLLVAVGARPNLDWEQEVEPWLGDDAGMAGWLRGRKGEDTKPSFVVWIETTDEDAATEAIRESVGGREDGSFEGAELRRGKGRLASVFWTVSDGRVLVGNAKGSVTAALRAAQGDALDEGDGWSRLRGDRGDDSFVSLYGTDSFTEQYERVLASLEQEGDTEAQDQLRRVADQLRGEAREFGVHLGSDDDGLWMESVAIGDQPAAEPDPDAPDALDLLERMPQTTVAAFASRTANVMDEDAVESARTSLAQYEPLLNGMPPLVRDLPLLATSLLDETYAARTKAAYRGDVALAVTADRGQLSLVGANGVRDERSALELEATTQQVLAKYAAKRSTLRLRNAPLAEGSTTTVTGIPATQWAAAIAGAFGTTPETVRAHPLGERFLQPQLTYDRRATEGSDSVFAFPGDAISLVEESVGGRATLADADRYTKAFQGASLPDDPDSVFWMDLRDLAQPLVEPVDGRAWPLVENQLEHVGGPLGWTESERSGKDTVRRSVVLVPLYE